MKNYISKGIKIVIACAIFSWFGLNLAHKIDLTTADLGRHIQNGNIIVNGTWAEKWAVLHTNFYSYTLTNQPFINHHWFSGVVFYFINLWFGFAGLSVWYVLFGLLTLWLFFDVARKASNFWIASACTVFVMPLITSRAEVRPEMFTYFLTGVFFWILWTARKEAELNAERRGSYKLLWILPLLMLFWINLHIGFVFGFLVLGAFGLGELIKDLRFKIKDKTNPWFGKNFLLLVYISALSIFASLVNPSFIKGLLYPLFIFKNYGYTIVENQSIRFLGNLNFTNGEHFLLFKILAGVILALFAGLSIRDWKKVDITMLVLSITTGVMAYFAIRNFPSFAFFAIPALSAAVYNLFPKKMHPAYLGIIIFFAAAMLFVSGVNQYQDYLAKKPILGFGLLPGVESSANFIKDNNIQGPIFNDYDVGSYLIYNLSGADLKNPDPGQEWGRGSVFVDNRPEAYTVDFFHNVYEPAQEDNAKWLALDKKYNFNVIFFSYRDYTSWAQEFLIARVNDPAWAPVYVDDYNIIFLKRNAQNAGLIKQFELPKSMFGKSVN